MGRPERRAGGPMAALERHWPEYLMEAAGLGLFMVSAGVFGTLLEYPHSPVHRAISDPHLRRALMGLAMGATAVGVIYSPWGQQTGAHINPAVTLTFFRLKKVTPWDAAFYVTAQFAGALLGVLAVARVAGTAFTAAPVNHLVTVPGRGGAGVAFAAEVVISFVLMLAILGASNHARVARYTGLLAGLLVALYIAIEAPISGMSMNPARTVGSAIPPRVWTSLWVYFSAPLLGMLLAAEGYVRVRGIHHVRCAKLNHHNQKRCIFRCGYRDQTVASTAGGQPEPDAN